MAKRGLVLFVGATGSGKSTSLAALIDHRNSNSAGHIITIEDPVEYIHRHKKSIVNQREVGVDTRSFQKALKNADSANNLRLRIKLHGQDGSSAKDRTGSGGPTGSGLSLQLEDDEEDPDQ